VQSPDEVAAVVVDVLEHPRADAYTAPWHRGFIASYYAAEDMSAVEKSWPRFGAARPAVAAAAAPAAAAGGDAAGAGK
jgi:hypothetical protein